MVSASVLHKLIGTPFCKGLTEKEGATILEISQEVTVDKGSVLFREGDPGDCVYVILEGRLAATKRDPSGADQPLARVEERDVVGVMSIIGGRSTCAVTLTAETDVRLLGIPASRFDDLVKRNDLAALKIVYNLAEVMSQRLEKVSEKVVSLLGQGKSRQELVEFQKILKHWSF
jgi:CRP-like cAMP-binding protein